MSIVLNASGKQGHQGPIECLQYELHIIGAKPGLAAAKEQELKVTIKVDKTTPRFLAAGSTGELFQNVTLSDSAQTPAFEIRLIDAFVAAVNRSSAGYDPKRSEDLEDVTFKFAGLEVHRGNP
jgi:type VI protein secretion system component Hcp